MPLSAKAKKTLAAMQKQYGAEKGKQVFYASVNKGTVQETMRRIEEVIRSRPK